MSTQYNIFRVKNLDFGIELIERLPPVISPDNKQLFHELGLDKSIWSVHVTIYENSLNRLAEVEEIIRSVAWIDISDPRESLIFGQKYNSCAIGWDYNHDWHADFNRQDRDFQYKIVKSDFDQVQAKLLEFFKN